MNKTTLNYLTKPRNLTMLTDFYEFTMSNAYFLHGMKDKLVTFDLFYRKNPDNGGYAICAGLEQAVQYIMNMHFTEEDITYLKKKGMSDGFCDYLRNFKFSGDIYAVPEGTPVFPYEPLIKVKAKIIDAQLVETMLLLTLNHQTLIATKANRIKIATGDKTVMEFGARRAHSYDAAILGARAASIGGVTVTATTIADELFGTTAVGTMAHSFIQSFPSEYEAFKAYATIYPDSCTLLIDTYNVRDGIENAIKVAKDYLIPNNHRLAGVRIDSGDLSYLSKYVRKRLNEEEMHDCKIVLSNSLDEILITSLQNQDTPFDQLGVGERLITSKSEPVFGGVYKLSSIEYDGILQPKIKLSENVEKITNPGDKMLYRLIDKETGMAIADVITLVDEVIDEEKPYRLFDPVNTWKEKIVTNFKVVPLLKTIIKDGELVYNLPELNEIHKYAKEQMNTLYPEVLRFDYPHTYYVDLSQKLWDLKQSMIEENSHK